MEKLARFLNKKKGLKILDVGTGMGPFINVITACTQEYSEIIGIDTVSGALEYARKNFPDERITFKNMDATKMDFQNETFDVVCLSNSLHHLKNISVILSEMKRVLKKDGIIVIAEMINNKLNSKQISHLKLHHFAAKIDRMRGDVHNDTYSDKEIIQILKEKSYMNVIQSWPLRILRGNEDLPDRFKWPRNTLERLLQRVPEENYENLLKEGNEIVEYIETHGFDTCPTLLVVMEK